VLIELKKLVQMPEPELARLDIAVVHLSTAVGIPGMEDLDAKACIDKLDALADWTQRYTEHCLANVPPEADEDCEGKMRMRCLGTVLWKGGGVAYNEAKIPEDAPWDLNDTFISGALFGPGGTCATLPIIYTAIGRRLGYPLKHVCSWGPKWGHLFCRWEGDGQRFNIEVNHTGVSFPEDAHYRHPDLDPEREKLGMFLRSMTPRQELAAFLKERAHCLRDTKNLRKAVEAYAWATSLVPENAFYLNTLKDFYTTWLAEVKAKEPPSFPQIILQVKQRRYPDGLPLRLEQDIVCLTLEENLLRNEELERRWWRPLRQGEWWCGSPHTVYADSRPGELDFSFRFPA